MLTFPNRGKVRHLHHQVDDCANQAMTIDPQCLIWIVDQRAVVEEGVDSLAQGRNRCQRTEVILLLQADAHRRSSLLEGFL